MEVLVEQTPDTRGSHPADLRRTNQPCQAVCLLVSQQDLGHRGHLVNVLCWPEVLSVTPVITSINSFLLKRVGIISYLYPKWHLKD